MTIDELYAAFERIHPSHRALVAVKDRGKAAHWLKLQTIPEEGMLSIPLVHLELGHGSAEALANFFLAAMTFAREHYTERREA